MPLAIVHGKNDPVVAFGMGQYAATLFGEAGWPAFRFFTDDTAGHMFGLLPVGEAIRWLEAMASDDPEVLLDFAEKQAEAGRYRDAIAALRTREEPQADRPAEAAGRPPAARPSTPRPRPSADEFLAQDQDERGRLVGRRLPGLPRRVRVRRRRPRGHGRLRSPAQAARAGRPEGFGEARAAFQQGKQDEGYAKYQEIVDKDYASSLYRNIKEQLKSRK